MEVQYFIHALSVIVGNDHLLHDKEEQYRYTVDHVSGKEGQPMCVVRPGRTEEVSGILALCNEHGIGVSVRGGGSGVSGGALCAEGAVVLSLERLNRIVEINAVDRYVVAEAGVVTQDLQDALLEHDLWFPQNISSASMSFIGGNVAVSSGSPKSMKYGSTKQYVLNLQVVLADGTVIWTGKNVTKNASGYNLTQLFTGSEGTLGIITRVVLQVVPPQKEILVLIPFSSMDRLFEVVKDFFAAGFRPSALEFLDANATKLSLSFLNQPERYGSDVQGLLWMEFEAATESALMDHMAVLEEFLQKHQINQSWVAQSKKDIEALWECRKRVGEAAVNKGHFNELDLVVPRSKASTMYKEVQEVCSNLRIDFIVVGHVGDGNFHVILFGRDSDAPDAWRRILAECTNRLFETAMALGGTLSGEHGIGHYNRSYFERMEASANLELMKKIKRTFDPNNILNTNAVLNEQKTKLIT